MPFFQLTHLMDVLWMPLPFVENCYYVNYVSLYLAFELFKIIYLFRVYFERINIYIMTFLLSVNIHVFAGGTSVVPSDMFHVCHLNAKNI